MSAAVREVVDGYTRAWTSKDYDGVRKLLADDLDFQGSMEQHNSAEGFLGGLKMFAENMYQSHTVLESIYGEERAFLLYDCVLANGTLRCSEYFQLADGKIEKIRLTFDTHAIKLAMGK